MKKEIKTIQMINKTRYDLHFIVKPGESKEFFYNSFNGNVKGDCIYEETLCHHKQIKDGIWGEMIQLEFNGPTIKKMKKDDLVRAINRKKDEKKEIEDKLVLKQNELFCLQLDLDRGRYE